MADSYPAFSLEKPRYSQDTFSGRLKHFLNITDPRTLFVSKKRLEDSIVLLDQFKNGTLPEGVSNGDLWEALKVKQAMIHPDTGGKIFMPFRMSGFVPFGSPIVVGMLLPNPSLVQTIFWQWLNQSHNACVNYANRNATKKTLVSRFVLGYCGAVTSAVGIAVSLSLLIRRASGMSQTMKLIVQKFVPFPAVATASTCNVVLMRYNELFEGIEVVNGNKQVIGTSQAAGWKALKETALTRMVLPAPILLIPPIVMTFLERTQLLKRRPRLHLPFNAVVSTLSFAFALPVAIALFPQTSSIRHDKLEPEIQQLTNDAQLYYNKGL